MIDSELSARKHTSQTKKHSFSEKTRSDYPSPHSPSQVSQAPVLRPTKTLGRKYAQQHLFKIQQKQHHEIVISDEVVRNSKLYRMLKEKIQIGEHKFLKQSKQLIETKQKLTKDISHIHQNNHHTKLSLWELKSQILELKAMLIDQEDEARRLESQVNNSQQPLYDEQEEEAEQQMPNHQEMESPSMSQEELYKNQYNKQQWLQLDSNELKQQQKDIKIIMSHLHKKIGLNPQKQREKTNEKFEQQEIE